MIRALVLVLMVSACAQAETPPPAMGEGQCRAEPAAGMIGRKMSDEAGQRALVLTGAAKVRWVRPGQAITMDYRTDRLNIHLDEKDRITRFSCG